MYGRTDGKKNRVIEELDREEETYRGRLEKRESEQGEEKRDKERNISKRKAIKRGTNGRDKQKGSEIVIQIKGHGANKEKQMERVDDQGRGKGREGMWRDKEKRINREIYA